MSLAPVMALSGSDRAALRDEGGRSQAAFQDLRSGGNAPAEKIHFHASHAARRQFKGWVGFRQMPIDCRRMANIHQQWLNRTGVECNSSAF
jgi:hypothetical protein